RWDPRRNQVSPYLPWPGASSTSRGRRRLRVECARLRYRELPLAASIRSAKPTEPGGVLCDLAVAHTSRRLGGEVTRAGLRHARGGVPDWKPWRLTQVRRATPRRRR